MLRITSWLKLTHSRASKDGPTAPSKFSTNSHIDCEPFEALYLEHSATTHNSVKPEE